MCERVYQWNVLCNHWTQKQFHQVSCRPVRMLILLWLLWRQTSLLPALPSVYISFYNVLQKTENHILHDVDRKVFCLAAPCYLPIVAVVFSYLLNRGEFTLPLPITQERAWSTLTCCLVTWEWLITEQLMLVPFLSSSFTSRVEGTPWQTELLKMVFF